MTKKNDKTGSCSYFISECYNVTINGGELGRSDFGGRDLDVCGTIGDGIHGAAGHLDWEAGWSWFI